MIAEHIFKAYLRVQKSGRYNMFSPEARIAVGTTKEEHMEIIEKYDELCEQYPETYKMMCV